MCGVRPNLSKRSAGPGVLATARRDGNVENVEIAKIFTEVADLLEIQGAKPFRVRAYRTAARTVETLTVSWATLASDPKALSSFPGIGKDLAGKICEITTTGELTLLKELTSQLPESLVEMMHIPSLGPMRAKLIYDSLGIKSSTSSSRLRARGGYGSCEESLQG